jgi:hypothetical protein
VSEPNAGSGRCGLESTTCPWCENEDCGLTWYKKLFTIPLAGAVFLGITFVLPFLCLFTLPAAGLCILGGPLLAITAAGSQERKCPVCEFQWEAKISWFNSEERIAKLARKHAIKKRIQVPA